LSYQNQSPSQRSSVATGDGKGSDTHPNRPPKTGAALHRSPQRFSIAVAGGASVAKPLAPTGMVALYLIFEFWAMMHDILLAIIIFVAVAMAFGAAAGRGDDD
jgi:hypothetical protein